MIAMILAVALNTEFCYAIPEPDKHAPRYLAITAELDACTHNWYTAPIYLADPRHTPSIWNQDYRPAIDDLAAMAEDYPGRLWLLYNEPERADQADTPAAAAAIHAGYWREAIGDNGRIACCGVLINEADDWRQWMDDYLSAGGPTPDAWHIHIYTASPATFERRRQLWDEWNHVHGSLPTVISEAGHGAGMYDYLREWHRDDYAAIYWFGLAELGMSSNTEVIYFPYLGGINDGNTGTDQRLH